MPLKPIIPLVGLDPVDPLDLLPKHEEPLRPMLVHPLRSLTTTSGT